MSTRPRRVVPDERIRLLTPGLIPAERMVVERTVLDSGAAGTPMYRGRDRAKMAMEGYQGAPPVADEALRRLYRRWPKLAENIIRCRPYQFVYERDRLPELRVLVCWTDSVASKRHQLYELSFDIAAEIGWYPLVTGSWIGAVENSVILKVRRLPYIPARFERRIGHLRRIRDLSIARPDSLGTCIEIEGEDGSILFDSGRSAQHARLRERLEHIKLVVITHAHSDHTAGIPLLLEHTTAPFWLTQTTLLQVVSELQAQGKDRLVDKLVRRSFLIRFDRTTELVCGLRFQFWSANHSPGSVLTLVTELRGRTVLISGDACLTNAYSDELLFAVRGTSARPLPRHVDFGVIDGAFLDPDTVPESQDTFEDVVRRAWRGNRNLLVLADSADLHMLLYWQFYDLVEREHRKESSVAAFVDATTRDLMVYVSNHYFRRDTAQLDVGLTKRWLARRPVFESVMLYWLDKRLASNVRSLIGHGRHLTFFMNPKTLTGADRDLSSAIMSAMEAGLDFAVVGRVDESKLVKRLVNEGVLQVGGRRLRLDGVVTTLDERMWLLHSDPDDLRMWVAGELGQKLEQVRIFHTYADNVVKALGTISNVARLRSTERF